MPVAEICRLAGLGQATYLNWKKKYAGLLPSEMHPVGRGFQIEFTREIAIMVQLAAQDRDGSRKTASLDQAA